MLFLPRVPYTEARHTNGQERLAHQDVSQHTQGEQPMSIDDNKAIVRRFQAGMAENFRTGNLDTVRAILDPDCAFDMPSWPSTVEGMLQVLPVFHTAFSDLQVTLGALIAEDDKVAYRLTWTGTHTGEFMGIPATGKRVAVTVTHIDQIANGKIVRHDGDSDQLGMLQQLGVIPAMG
jgi:steroid delta-isomerase-like uncharacterized protein